MSYDIYLCGECLCPIWFPFGDKMHLGTGWYCWKAQQEREGEHDEVEEAVGEFVFSTDAGLLKELVAEALQLYAAWVASKGRKAQLVPFLRRQLVAGRSDVLHDFFRHLTKEPREHTGAVVREITTTPEWRRFARRAVRRQRARQGRRSQRAS